MRTLAETVGKFVAIPSLGSRRTYQPLAQEAPVAPTAVGLAALTFAVAIGRFIAHTIGYSARACAVTRAAVMASWPLSS